MTTSKPTSLSATSTKISNGMNILIATALFPPDVADPAPYVKELATRLAKDHTVTVLAYGSLPEKIPEVTFITISKKATAALRLWRFTWALFRTTKTVDKILIQNGSSAELPALIISLWRRKKMVLMMSDHKVDYTGWRLRLHTYLKRRITTIETTTLLLPATKPEIHPLREYPTERFINYEQSWQRHLSNLKEHLS